MKKFFLVLMFYPLFPGFSYGWVAGTHKDIATNAARNKYLPPEFGSLLIKNDATLKEGSVFPDIYDAGEIRSHNTEICLEMVLKIKEELLRPERALDKKFYLDLGRMCHYIGDNNQPLHSDQKEYEHEFHQRYEDDADELKIKYVPQKPVYIADITELFSDDEKYDWEVYGDIADAYMNNSGNPIKEVEKLTRNQIRNSYVETADIWYTIWREKLFLTLQSQLKTMDDYLALSGEYMKDGLSDKAIDVLNKGIKIYPAEVKLYSRLAFIYQKMNELKKSAGICRDCLKKNPQDVDMRYRLAFLYEDLDNKSGAIDEWKKLQGTKYDAEVQDKIAQLSK